MAEKDCTEVGLAEKSNPTAREKVRERQIRIYGGDYNDRERRISIVLGFACSANGKSGNGTRRSIRIAGRIEYEFLDNGCINWDEDFKKMLDAFLRYVQLGNGFSGDDLSSAELLVHLLKDNGDKGFIDDNLTTVLCSCAIAWVKQNPETIPLLDADYIR